MSEQIASVDQRIALARDGIRALMGIVDWMQESGQLNKAETLRLVAFRIDDSLDELCNILAKLPLPQSDTGT